MSQIIATEVVSKTLTPTMRLRWLHQQHKDNGFVEVRITLQQAWIIQETGELEWYDVETVKQA